MSDDEKLTKAQIRYRKHRARMEADPAYAEAYRARHRDIQRNYAAQNRDKTAEFARRWRRKNPQSVKETQKRWREKNPEAVKRARDRDREKHREKRREWNRKYIARKRAGLTTNRVNRQPGFSLMAMCRQAIPASLPRSVREEATARLVLAVLEGKVAQHKIGEAAKKIITKAWGEIDRHKTLSLDDAVPGHDRTRYVDLLADDVERF